MDKEKKSKLTNISLWVLLGVLILFVIISSCVVKAKQDRLNDLSQKNDQIEDKLENDEGETEELVNFFEKL
ncbi:MAG: hypothetical protein IJZ62_04355 [Clostridia bacterium]|nr:hypothetical protein [Clostridia bacterium]